MKSLVVQILGIGNPRKHGTTVTCLHKGLKEEIETLVRVAVCFKLSEIMYIHLDTVSCLLVFCAEVSCLLCLHLNAEVRCLLVFYGDVSCLSVLYAEVRL